MNMGEKIKMLREQNNMTLEELGNKVGVGKSTVRKWENGMIANMKRDKIASLSNALGVSPAYLMGWDDNAVPDSSPVTLRPDESSLLSDYNRLNPLGRDEASKRVKELTRISEYVKKENSGSLSQVG